MKNLRANRKDPKQTKSTPPRATLAEKKRIYKDRFSKYPILLQLILSRLTIDSEVCENLSAYSLILDAFTFDRNEHLFWTNIASKFNNRECTESEINELIIQFGMVRRPYEMAKPEIPKKKEFKIATPVTPPRQTLTEKKRIYKDRFSKYPMLLELILERLTAEWVVKEDDTLFVLLADASLFNIGEVAFWDKVAFSFGGVAAPSNDEINDLIYKFGLSREPHTKTKHPDYYGGDTPTEPIKYIDAHNLNFNRGNVVKYVTRAGKKNPETELEDLEKASNYLQFELEKLKFLQR